MKSALEYNYIDGYDYEKDADECIFEYENTHDTLVYYLKTKFMKTEFSVYSDDFELWYREIAKIKQQEYRNNKIDSIL